MPDRVKTGLSTCCWQWLAAKDTKGYGQFRMAHGMMRAHRQAWLLAGNELPEKPLSLDHICRNKLCVRVEHFRVATQSQQEFNKGLQSNNTSGVRGVQRWCSLSLGRMAYWHKRYERSAQ